MLPVSYQAACFLLSLKSKLALYCQTKKTKKMACNGLEKFRKIVTLQKLDKPANMTTHFPEPWGGCA